MKTILVAALLASASVLACQFDVDCDVGSKCVKKSGQLYGVCVGGSSPGNNGDKTPVYDPGGTNTGKTCSFDVDCGAGGKCVKQSGQLEGVCFGGR